MEFPYGKAPLAILIMTLLAGVGLAVVNISEDVAAKPDLVYATFTKEHASAYKPALPAFEKKYNVHVQLQVVDQKALQQRLASAMQVGAEVPDMVELLDQTMGYFTSGPIADVGFADLTHQVHDYQLNGRPLWDQLVTARFGKWTSRGHIFALVHDVHPTMLCYRRDIVEQLGIDVNKLTTWDEFCRVGREVTEKSRVNGVVQHYMIDLPDGEPWGAHMLLLQRGGGLFDSAGNVTFDNDIAIDVACWYVKQTGGPQRIAFPAGWGQSLSKCMIDGLCLFYVCPDWRTAQFQADLPSLSGKLALIPMPAWEPGGRRTSTWGATGLAITKQCKNFDLAWKLAMYLYYDPNQLGPRYAGTNILPPYKPAWSQPQFHESREYYSGQKIGELYQALADQVPNEQGNTYSQKAEDKFWEAVTNVNIYYTDHPNDDAGLRESATRELKRCADDVRRIIDRNLFIKDVNVVTAPSPQKETVQ